MTGSGSTAPFAQVIGSMSGAEIKVRIRMKYGVRNTANLKRR